MMQKVRIFDNTFTGFTKSASLREENKDVSPTHFEWDTKWHDDNYNDVVFYTDCVINPSSNNPVFWLLEPRCLHPENYEFIEKNHELYRAVLTYDQQLLDTLPNARFYPLGGSSIAFSKWGIYPKTRDICMFYSGKETTEGHKLRKQIVEELGDRIDVYGAGVGRPVDSKFEVLRDYRFCVVVESCFDDGYFSEKLIDPISVGTIPLYISETSMRDLGIKFPGRFGVYDPYHLDIIIKRLEKNSPSFYYEDALNSGNLENNIEICKQYAICEDFIFNNYPDLFED